MRYANFIISIALLSPLLSTAQIFTQNVKAPETILVEGKVYDEISGTPLNQAKVTIFDDMMIASLAQTETDATGSYSMKVPKVSRYMVTAEKPTYFDEEIVMTHLEGALQVDLGLGRKPGYAFDITIFDKAYEHNTINLSLIHISEPTRPY